MTTKMSRCEISKAGGYCFVCHNTCFLFLYSALIFSTRAYARPNHLELRTWPVVAPFPEGNRPIPRSERQRARAASPSSFGSLSCTAKKIWEKGGISEHRELSQINIYGIYKKSDIFLLGGQRFRVAQLYK